jgi:acyl-CoA thioester hydrolase
MSVSAAAPFCHELRVRFGECDPQGVVFNANYHLYFDVAFTEFWRQAVGPWSTLAEHGVECVLAHTDTRFLGPARADDVLRLEARVTHLGTTSMSVRIATSRDAERLNEGRLRYVFIDPVEWRKTPIPDPLRAQLNPYLDEQELA